ncbi:THUMP domain-containing class I SAM-dependent RNA methyltransferase [Pseudobdellovibrio exovorus]|uniref:Putative N6-adenine-specific DNA methylase n=1 Tax=Pseudobdellovibrio exovorus JSS TaxID=1184267 RepID=M4V735_9BACT|nr:THUMP domain-containing protein [Pseudobdellovibrio exovorus]AGH94998.1 putative N6-adenine-specific DNA methylase [Pseudobdellovibrio exovorus JSS]
MAHFYASCPKGLSDLVEKELQSFGLKTWEKSSGGVMFESNWAGCYKANLNSRYASRILKPLLDFPAYQNDELYHNIRKHDFTKYIKPTQTISVDVVVKECKLHDQRFVAMKIKDAIVDQFREKFGVRPDVNTEKPDLRIHVRGVKNQFAVSLDTSGDSLFMRGYRLKTGEAPLKENLAAGLIGLTDWDKKTPIVDLFAGSGTILIEAAMMALNVAPGLQRKRFGFMSLLDFDEQAWEQTIQEAIESEKEELDFQFYGYDIDKKVLDIAKRNAKSAGVAEYIVLKNTPVSVALPPEEKCLVICNPPYGSRIGDEDNLKDVYRDLGFTLKHRFTGNEAWILSGNKDLLQEMKLKSTRRHFVYNGNIECRFLKYEMYEGSHRKPKDALPSVTKLQD